MSGKPWRKALDSLAESTVDLLWRQWRAIGAGASARGMVARQVDPEALILGSLALGNREARLSLVMPDWLLEGARLISTQRLRNLAPKFGEPVHAGLSALAHLVVHDAKDARWRSLATPSSRADSFQTASRRRSGGVDLLNGPALMLRLRAAFGVGVKADLLAFLLGQELRSTVSGAAESLACSPPTAFRALQDLVGAGFARADEVTAATEYRLESQAWSELLGPGKTLVWWGWWAEVLAYVVDLLRTAEGLERKKVTEFVVGVTLRDVAERHTRGITRARGLKRFGAPPETAEPSDWVSFWAELEKHLREGA